MCSWVMLRSVGKDVERSCSTRNKFGYKLHIARSNLWASSIKIREQQRLPMIFKYIKILH